MIPAKKEDISITSNIEGEKIKMGIAEDATEHIIALLTDLYSDPELAIIREISANARDSHVEAGQTRPIEVSTPTNLSPVFKVQDWGVGLDEAGLRNVYAMYGASTKRDTNEQTGSLGLGCKSPLTYTNQFTVVAVKDGVQRSVMVSRDEDGIPTMDIVDTRETTEPNGVAITIPAKRYSEIRRKAEQFFRFWPEGTVLLDGQEPDHYEGGLAVTPQITLHDDTYNRYGYNQRQSYVMMGAVPYPLDAEYIAEMGLQYTQFVIMEVPLGSIHFTPSREALMYTKRTKQVIADLVAEYNVAVIKAAQAEIDACDNRPDALATMHKWRNSLARRVKHEFNYRGEQFPTEVKCPGQILDPTTKRPTDQSPVFTVAQGKKDTGTKMTWTQRKAQISSHELANSVFLYHFDRGFTATVKRKIWHYMDTNGIKYPEQLVLSSRRVKSPWIRKEAQLDWNDIKDIKLPREGKARVYEGRIAGSYDLYDVGGFQAQMLADEIDYDHIFYAGSESSASYDATRLKNLGFDNFCVVVIFENRRAKFLRLFPEAGLTQNFIEEAFKEWWDSLSKFTQLAISVQLHVNNTSAYRHLKVTKLKDPELVQAIRASKHPVDKELAIMSTFGRRRGSVPYTDPLERYPLYESQYYSPNKATILHNHIYINAAYEELYANA